MYHSSHRRLRQLCMDTYQERASNVIPNKHNLIAYRDAIRRLTLIRASQCEEVLKKQLAKKNILSPRWVVLRSLPNPKLEEGREKNQSGSLNIFILFSPLMSSGRKILSIFKSPPPSIHAYNHLRPKIKSYKG